ncbi:MAG: DinB family protein [Thermomicrobiales bacterium]
MDQKETLRALVREATQDLRDTVADIPQELFERRPGPGLNPANFIYFHVLRAWDLDTNVLCRGQERDGDAWHRGGFGDELNYEPLGHGAGGSGIGFGYDDDEVNGTPKDHEALMRYHQILEDETYAYFDAVSLDELNRERSSEHSRENPYRPERWIRHMISHTNMHIGDIQYVKGMLGM